MKLFGTRVTPTALIGMLIILVCVGSAVFAPWISPHDSNAPLGQRWAAPSIEHWFGLDQIGRDMFSRMLYGGRVLIALAFLATCLAFVIGTVAGLTASIAGRWADILLSRVADLILAMPVPISALIVISAMGSSVTVLVLTIGLLQAAIVYRVARAAAMNIVILEFFEAARLRGEGLAWLIWREILPNALTPLAAEFGRRFSFAFLFVASLGFLGLGAQLPDADWGSMVKESAFAIPAGFAAPLFPAAAIALLTIGVNMVADWLVSLPSRPHAENA